MRATKKLLNSLGDDEAVLFADAVHPTHAAGEGLPAAGRRAKKKLCDRADESGRQRINIHGAIDLETGANPG